MLPLLVTHRFVGIHEKRHLFQPLFLSIFQTNYFWFFACFWTFESYYGSRVEWKAIKGWQKIQMLMSFTAIHYYHWFDGNELSLILRQWAGIRWSIIIRDVLVSDSVQGDRSTGRTIKTFEIYRWIFGVPAEKYNNIWLSKSPWYMKPEMEFHNTIASSAWSRRCSTINMLQRYIRSIRFSFKNYPLWRHLNVKRTLKFKSHTTLYWSFRMVSTSIGRWYFIFLLFQWETQEKNGLTA